MGSEVPTSPVIAAGAVLAGKYKLEALIGQGGMGTVWSATHLGLGKHVAVKLITSGLARHAEIRKRFDTEAKAGAKLQSRHVVQIFDNGELEDGTPFIAMELLRGQSLQARLEHGGAMPLADVVQMVTHVARALGRAHALGIIHRDIKPDNIFLSESDDDDGVVVKVLDFGIAKFSMADEAQSTTRTGAMIGTPLYMSPEQARGLRGIDGRSDLYSLGLVVYTALTCVQPFAGASFGDLILQICTRSLPSLVKLQPQLPVALDAWFYRACAREPADRFQTAQQMAEAIVALAGVVPAALSSTPSLELALSGSGETQSLGTQPTFVAAAPPSIRSNPFAQNASASGSMGAAPAVAPPQQSSLVALAQNQSLGGIANTPLQADLVQRQQERPKPLAKIIVAGAALVVVAGIGVLAFGRFGPRHGDTSASATASAPTATPPAQSVASSAGTSGAPSASIGSSAENGTTTPSASGASSSAPSRSASAPTHRPLHPAQSASSAPLDIKLTH